MRTLVIAVLGLTASACIPGNSPIRVTGTFTQDNGCKIIDDPQLIRGRLDLAGNGEYRIFMQIDSELSTPSNMSQTGVELVSPGANNWIVDEMLLSYTANPVIPAFKAERIAFHGVVRPGGSQFLGANIITEDALQKLRDTITDPAMTPVTTLNVRIELKGHLESSTTVLGAIATNPITFPITVVTSSATNMACPGAIQPTCPPAGQDGSPIICCTGPGQPLGCP